jgi:hypothetical protein
MKLSRTVGLAVAVSLVAGTIAAIAPISGAATAGPTANVVDAGPSTPPGSNRPYRKRNFAGGAVLVKEVFATSTNKMTTGTVTGDL